MSEEIIDGVNVAECRFLDEWKHCDICEKLCDSKCLIVEDIECKTYDDCYYKQLKRLQAENEELKNQIKKQKNAKIQLKNLDSRFADDYCKVKEENKELKEAADGLLKIQYALADSCNKYSNALENIKEIISKRAIIKPLDQELTGLAKDYFNIGKIVSEVLDETVQD